MEVLYTLIIAKIGKGNNSVITCDWVMVLELCISSHCPLSICQVSFKSPRYFQKYAPDKPIITIIRKGNNSIITCDIAMVLAFTISLIALYQCIKFHLIPFYTLRDMLRTSLLLKKLRLEVTQ